MDRLKKILFAAGSAILLFLGALLGARIARSGRNDRSADHPGIDEQLGKEKGNLRREGELVVSEGKRIDAERKRLEREGSLNDDEKSILSRDEQLLSELQKRSGNKKS